MDTAFGTDLLPRRVYKKITDITPADLHALGAAGLLLDIDNTLAYDGSFTFFPGVKPWVQAMAATGVPMMILSNTYALRARVLAKKLGLPYLAQAEKPSTRGYLRCASQLDLPPESLAMAGDQLFTDVRGAVAAGCIPLLVLPQHKELLFYFRYRKLRGMERQFLQENGLPVSPKTITPRETPGGAQT